MSIDKQNIQAAKKSKASPYRKFAIFLAFELIFTIFSMTILVFYGPFNNIKRTVVGMSWNTLTHQYIAKFFLSDKAILKILGDSFAVDPMEQGGEVQTLNFGAHHTDRIDLYNIDGGNYAGKMMLIYDPTRVVAGIFR